MATTKGKMKQRSFYMDDETYALIERRAEQIGESNGRALRMIVRRHEGLDDTPAEPVSQRQEPPLPPQMQERAAATVQRAVETGIVLPPDRQETFKVPERFKEKGPRAPRAQHVDDDF